MLDQAKHCGGSARHMADWDGVSVDFEGEHQDEPCRAPASKETVVAHGAGPSDLVSGEAACFEPAAGDHFVGVHGHSEPKTSVQEGYLGREDEQAWEPLGLIRSGVWIEHPAEGCSHANGEKPCATKAGAEAVHFDWLLAHVGIFPHDQVWGPDHLARESHRPGSGAGEPAGVVGSRVAGGHHGVTRSALDAARRWAESGAVGRRRRDATMARLGRMASTQVLPSFRRPYGRRMVASLVVAGLLGLIGSFPLMVGLAPSDPCVPGDEVGCGPEPTYFLQLGGKFILVGLVPAVIGAGFAWYRSRLRFVTPPAWPRPPAGWKPPRSWEPDPRWPAAPDGWVFWRRGG